MKSKTRNILLEALKDKSIQEQILEIVRIEFGLTEIKPRPEKSMGMDLASESNSVTVKVSEYELYLNLDSQTKKELANVICSETTETFLVSGVQLENIEALWDYITFKLNTCDVYTIEKLKTILTYFFRLYNQAMNSYEFLNTEIGDELDEDFHTRGMNSQVSGKIKEVFLLGYRNQKTKKVIKKSIVRV